MYRLRLRIVSRLALLAIALVFLAAPVLAAAEPEPNPQALARVMAVQDRHTPRLMAPPGVVGTATGLDGAGNPVVKVYVTHAGVAGLPNNVEGVPVVVEVSGKFFALPKPPGGGSKPPRVDRTAWFDSPVPIGVSTGHPNITAGTIGCRVKDLSGKVYALSNNHIYADCNYANYGDIVLQPGPYDGGGKTPGRDDVIGRLSSWAVIVFSSQADNTIDAAIALNDPMSMRTMGKATPLDGYGTPKSATVPASIRQKVKKYGRTTGLTTGTVKAVNATVLVSYGDVNGDSIDDVARFVSQIIVTPGSFSAGGDSGSLVVQNGGTNDRKPVGLLFAGSATMTVCNPIDLVLDGLGLTIDGE